MDALLHLLPSLIALVEEQSVTRAAKRLGLSQPRMSARLAELRAILGDPLLVTSRGTRGLVATDRARLIADEGRIVIRRLGDVSARDAFDPVAASRTFTIMSNDNAAAIAGLPLALAVNMAGGPALRVAIVQFEGLRLGDLETGGLDLVLGATSRFAEATGLISRVIVRDRFVSAVRRGAEVASDIDAFCARPHVIVSGDGGGFDGPIDRLLGALGRSRRVILSVQSYLVAVQAVMTGDVIATLPRSLLTRFADRLTLFDPPVDLAPFSLSAAWHPRVDADAAHRWLRAQFA